MKVEKSTKNLKKILSDRTTLKCTKGNFEAHFKDKHVEEWRVSHIANKLHYLTVVKLSESL